MRIFKYLAVAGVASASVRTKRDASFTITGEETEEELDAILAQLGGDDEGFERNGIRDQSDDTDMLNPRKFKQWKLLIRFLYDAPKRPWKNFQSYGCHCLPSGNKKIAENGYGDPVDNIDAQCKKFHQCYRCLSDEHADETKGCDGENTRYRFSAATLNGQKSVTCLNDPGTCRYNTCQCDLQLANRLTDLSDEYDFTYHLKGGFDRAASCHKNGGGGNNFEECCGDKNTFPYNEIKRTGNCCLGPESKPANQC